MIGRRSTADPSDTLHPIMEVSFDVVIMLSDPCLTTKPVSFSSTDRLPRETLL